MKILSGDEEDKENSPPKKSFLERPNQPPALLRSRAFETTLENVPDFVHRKLLQEEKLCMYFDVKRKQKFQFMIFFFTKQSDMCKTKTNLVLLSKILLVGAVF